MAMHDPHAPQLGRALRALRLPPQLRVWLSMLRIKRVPGLAPRAPAPPPLPRAAAPSHSIARLDDDSPTVVLQSRPVLFGFFVILFAGAGVVIVAWLAASASASMLAHAPRTGGSSTVIPRPLPGTRPTAAAVASARNSSLARCELPVVSVWELPVAREDELPASPSSLFRASTDPAPPRTLIAAGSAHPAKARRAPAAHGSIDDLIRRVIGPTKKN
jgi:hypothetical protein